jgi:peroxiredoxin Q/BCP
MRKAWMGWLLAGQMVMAGAAQALLAPGNAAPDFALQAAQGGETFEYRLYEALEKGPVVIFFYPKAFTSGCTVQARMFARAKDQFTALGAAIIGLSADSLEVAKDFSLKECSSAYPVVADPDGKAVKAYDASMLLGSATSKRASYVITPDRKIFYVYSDMSPQDHVTKTLDAVKRWKSLQPAPAAATEPAAGDATPAATVPVPPNVD